MIPTRAGEDEQEDSHQSCAAQAPVPTGGANQGVEKLFQTEPGASLSPERQPGPMDGGNVPRFWNTVDRRRREWAI